MGLEKRDYAQVIDVYNSSGSAAATNFLKESYGIKCPRQLLYRLKNNAQYMYDSSADKFAATTLTATGEIFMGLEELCKAEPAVQFQQPSGQHNEVSSIKDLMQQLVLEKLLELNTYIQINHLTKVVTIKKSALVLEGFSVVIK